MRQSLEDFSNFGDRTAITPAELEHLNQLTGDMKFVRELLADVSAVPGEGMEQTLEGAQEFVGELRIGMPVIVNDEPAIVLGGHVGNSTASMGVIFADGRRVKMYTPEKHEISLAA